MSSTYKEAKEHVDAKPWTEDYFRKDFTSKFENIKNEEKFAQFSNKCQIYNALTSDVKNKLWKRKYDFKRSEEILTLVNKYVQSNGSTLKYNRNKANLGMGKNIIQSAMMAKGEYTWIIGNDDLLFPESLKKIFLILKSNKNIDFFFINSANLEAKYTINSKKLFNTNLIPKNLPKFSPIKKNLELNFLDLIDPKISFDYLLGIYLSIFKTLKFNVCYHKIYLCSKHKIICLKHKIILCWFLS
jgi:hypothetical protein